MGFRSLIAYKKGFELAMDIFNISKSFPNEEKYSLTDQVKRSSRSVCANIAESYRKMKYPKHFVSKLTDSSSENGETQTWIDFAYACNYINIETQKELTQKNEEVGKLLFYTLLN